MLNQAPGYLGLKLTTNFGLVHNTKPDPRKRFDIFSIGYFNNTVDNTDIRSKLQAHNLDVIAVSGENTSNGIIFYNPLTSIYYCHSDFLLKNNNCWSITLPILSVLTEDLPEFYFEK